MENLLFLGVPIFKHITVYRALIIVESNRSMQPKMHSEVCQAQKCILEDILSYYPNQANMLKYWDSLNHLIFHMGQIES